MGAVGHRGAFLEIKNIYKKEFSFREEFLGEEFKKNPCSAQ